MIRSVIKTVSKTLKNYFDLEEKHGYRNLLDAISLRWGYVFGSARSKEITGTPYVEYKPCPTCYKYIPCMPRKGAEVADTGFSGRL